MTESTADAGRGDPQAPAAEASPGLSAGWQNRRRRVAGAIEDVAVRLFAERGYHQVTVEDVATAAGCSVRTVTRYFPTKEDLLLDYRRLTNGVVLEAFSALDAASVDAAGNGSDAGPASAIWAVWTDLSRRSREAWPRYLRWIEAAATAPDVVDRADGERRRMLERALGDVIARWLGTDPGLDVRPRAMAATLAAANEAVVDFWVRRGGTDDLDVLFERAGRQLADLGLVLTASGRADAPGRAQQS